MGHLRIFAIIFLVTSSLSGCGAPKTPAPEEKVVAKINNYDMTAGDFRDAARAISGTKEQIMEELIVRNVLVQEAQRENFDKDRAFMKEIEKYWEQALLKVLIKKKTAEFTTAFKGDKAKVENALNRWARSLRNSAKVKIYKEDLDEVTIP